MKCMMHVIYKPESSNRQMPANESTWVTTCYLLLLAVSASFTFVGLSPCWCPCAGAAGSFIVQFAKRAGAKVVTTVGSTAKADVAKALGAKVVINYRSQDVSAALANTCPEGFDWVVDGVGGTLQDTLISHMKPGAMMLQIGYISEYPHTGTQP
jgi:NADPH-dependent curcumin reductase CurA